MAPKKKGKKTLGPPLRNEINEDKNPNKSLTEGEKNFYRAQIRDLEERLERYQYKCDKLEVEEKDLLSKISSLGTEKKDIVLYLKRSLVQKEDELSEMAETLSQHQKDLETERKRSELQQSLLRCEHQKDREILASENTALAGRLSSLEEFSLQREKLTAKCRSLEEQLQQQHQEHKEEIYRLEKKAILDQDRSVSGSDNMGRTRLSCGKLQKDALDGTEKKGEKLKRSSADDVSVASCSSESSRVKQVSRQV